MFEIRVMHMDSPRKLTQGVLQAGQLLGLYPAELARILGLQCADVAELANAQNQLDLNSAPGRQALKFIDLFQRLYHHCDGDGAAMCHWLRSSQVDLPSTPFLMIVDGDALDSVVDWLDNCG